FKLDEPWDSEHNKTLMEKMPEVFRSPVGNTGEKHMTHYQLLVGGRATFEDKQSMRFPSSTPDGVSQTLFIVEAEAAVPWTKPADLIYNPKKPLPKFGGLFKGGFHAAFGDCSVRFVSMDNDEATLRAIITRDGGEKVDMKPLK